MKQQGLNKDQIFNIQSKCQTEFISITKYNFIYNIIYSFHSIFSYDYPIIVVLFLSNKEMSKEVHLHIIMKYKVENEVPIEGQNADPLFFENFKNNFYIVFLVA